MENRRYFFLSPPLGDNPFNWAVVSGQCLLFIVGLCGQVSVLARIQLLRRVGVSSSMTTHLTVLSLIELVVILTIPFAILNRIMGYWILGSFLCKVYQVTSSLWSVLYAPILFSALLNRMYASTANQRAWRRYCLLGLIVFCSVTLLAPLGLYSHSRREIISKAKRSRKAMMIYTCFNRMTDTQIMVSAACSCALGCLAPLLACGYLLKKMENAKYLKRQFVLYSICCSLWWLCVFVQASGVLGTKQWAQHAADLVRQLPYFYIAISGFIYSSVLPVALRPEKTHDQQGQQMRKISHSFTANHDSLLIKRNQALANIRASSSCRQLETIVSTNSREPSE